MQFFLQIHPQLVSDQKKHHKHPYKTTGMKSLASKSINWYEPWYCGTVGNKLDPCGKYSCGKLFSYAGGHNEYYLCGLTYSALEMHKSTMKTCDLVSSHDIKKKAGSYFIMRADL